MFFDSVFFDIDNTLYDYDSAHQLSLEKSLTFISKENGIPLQNLEEKYLEVSENLKYEFPSNYTSRNRSLYFKRLIEHFSLPYYYSLKANDIYWEFFFSSIVAFPKTLEVLEFLKSNGVKICAISDFSVEHQLQKLEKLGLLPFFDFVFTSEEAGIEKPGKKIFQMSLFESKSDPSRSIMIGDDFHKDVKGSLNCGIYPFHFRSGIEEILYFPDYLAVGSMEHCLHLFEKYLDATKNIEKLSKFFGEREDLVQGAGGNISIKVENLMLIKSSGFQLGNVTCKKGFSVLDFKALNSESRGKNIMNYVPFTSERPSMESYFHAILKKYVVHLHPTQVNKILCKNYSKEIIIDKFPEALVLDYYTPGIFLKEIIEKEYVNHSVIFLINHGIIFTHDNYDFLGVLIKETLEKCEEISIFDSEVYNLSNSISKKIDSLNNYKGVTRFIGTLSSKQDTFLNGHLFPDSAIYFGIKILHIDCNIDQSICNYYLENGITPKILISGKYIFLNFSDLSKCLEAEMLLRSIREIGENNSTYLKESDVEFLLDYEPEKFRKQI